MGKRKRERKRGTNNPVVRAASRHPGGVRTATRTNAQKTDTSCQFCAVPQSLPPGSSSKPCILGSVCALSPRLQLWYEKAMGMQRASTYT